MNEQTTVPRSLSILGSTGSIGRQTVNVVQRSGGRFRVKTLAAGKNVTGLEEQIRLLRPEAVCLMDPAAAKDLTVRVKDLPVTVLSGMEGMKRLIEDWRCGVYAISISGMIALRPVLWAIRTGARIALSNKESIVTAGHIMMPAVRENGAELLPVDSEHSAIFQCLEGERQNRIKKILLTASGGPFRGKTRDELKDITPAQALRHPNWSMGAKITVDSATLANKGLEVMEAHHLFGVSYDQVQVVVHPQSIIHSMVEFSDGAVKAQLGVPDMRLPIEYALNYPDRRTQMTEELDFWDLPDLHFEKPDPETFPALRLAYEAGRIGGTMPTVFNAANETAVADFLKGKLPYLGIADRIENAMARHRVTENPSLEEILAAEEEVRRTKD
ncbi:MAG: 1-deoxy-D-xylulose-5-phosphate reductoisomerase [Lachnospiraceae bacterium]|nr:1-deoxy-D-xylulose-5-phosphate reductoisomerase [Lachnospiraceae bacterium]